MTTISWVTLSDDDLLAALTSRERDDFGMASAGVGVPDRVFPILETLVAEVRGRIATWSQNTLSADATRIPPSFKSHALAIARWRLLVTVPGYEPGDARKEEYKAALKFLEDVAAGKMRPETAGDAVRPSVPDEKPAGVQWSAPGSRTGRQRMNGL